MMWRFLFILTVFDDAGSAEGGAVGGDGGARGEHPAARRV